ncbi:MAG TPA: hypothetical protein DEB09_03140 [Candidatus Magasanikbacteria bacterium]|nr:hypothetical protein [Candidatus Magasanikbacteria bacterium]
MGFFLRKKDTGLPVAQPDQGVIYQGTADLGDAPSQEVFEETFVKKAATPAGDRDPLRGRTFDYTELLAMAHSVNEQNFREQTASTLTELKKIKSQLSAIKHRTPTDEFTRMVARWATVYELLEQRLSSLNFSGDANSQRLQGQVGGLLSDVRHDKEDFMELDPSSERTVYLRPDEVQAAARRTGAVSVVRERPVRDMSDASVALEVDKMFAKAGARDVVVQSGGPEPTGPLPRKEIGAGETDFLRSTSLIMGRVYDVETLGEAGIDALEKDIKTWIEKAKAVIAAKNYDVNSLRASVIDFKRALESKKEVFGVAWARDTINVIKLNLLLEI